MKKADEGNERYRFVTECCEPEHANCEDCTGSIPLRSLGDFQGADGMTAVAVATLCRVYERRCVRASADCDKYQSCRDCPGSDNSVPMRRELVQ